MKTKGPMYSETLPTNCPTCGGKLRSLMFPLTRYLKCLDFDERRQATGCFAVFWWDGPSLLERGDKCAKRSHTGYIEELTEEQSDKVARI